MKHTAINFFAAAVLVFGATAAFGQTTRNSPVNADNISAQVNANCTITTFDISFGIYDPVSANAVADKDTMDTLTVRCTKGSTPIVWLSQGVNYSAGRRMLNTTTAGEYLLYELYTDSPGGAAWGSDASTGATVTLSGTDLMDATLDVHARLFGGQPAAVGAYRDTVIATIQY